MELGRILDQAKKYWVGFNLVKGIGSVRLGRLLAHFGDAQAAWQASASELSAAGLSPRLVQSLLQTRVGIDLDQIWDSILVSGVQVLTWEDDDYPSRLKEIDQPPPVVYMSGELIPQDEWAVAVVGTRQMSAYGRQVTETLAATLARRGVTVVSGLARGVDTVAHQAALDAGGRTLAVLGSGVDRVYPPENRRLAQGIVAQGALLSDYPPGTPPEAANFPPRNRIISGLSLAVVVVEAGERSGALITASFAADQGRDVFAVPGNILAPQSRGANRLIQDGARPVLSPEDVLEALDLTLATERRTAQAVLPSDPTEARLIAVIGHEPRHIDDIGAQLAMPAGQISAALAMMELKGLVRQVGGQRYVVFGEIGPR